MKEFVFETEIKGIKLTFTTTPGVFSWKHVDAGTELLLKKIKIEEDDQVLDIGCGYGPIGIFCAKHAVNGNVDMVDKDFTAVEYATKNCKQNNVESNTNVFLSNGLSKVPENKKYTLITSNLPANVGKEVWIAMFKDAAIHLAPQGRIYIVVINNLRPFIRRMFLETFGNYKKVAQNDRYSVLMAKQLED
jgi:16S rRNA (guanine1207-N2)-methyltransferase